MSKNTVLLLLVLILFLGAAAWVVLSARTFSQKSQGVRARAGILTGGSRLVFDKENQEGDVFIELGMAERFFSISYAFTFTNVGLKPLQIESVEVVEGNGRISFPKDPIEVGRSGEIVVVIDPIRAQGQMVNRFKVRSSDLVDPERLLTVSAFIE